MLLNCRHWLLQACPTVKFLRIARGCCFSSCGFVQVAWLVGGGAGWGGVYFCIGIHSKITAAQPPTFCELTDRKETIQKSTKYARSARSGFKYKLDSGKNIALEKVNRYVVEMTGQYAFKIVQVHR